MPDLRSLSLAELRALRNEYAAIMAEHKEWHPTGGFGFHQGDQRSWNWAEAGFRACGEEQMRRRAEKRKAMANEVGCAIEEGPGQ